MVALPPGTSPGHIWRHLRARDHWPINFEDAWRDLDYERTFALPDWRALILETLRALANGDPEPLRRRIAALPLVLADPLVQMILHQLWGRQKLKSPAGEHAKKTLAALFNGIGRSPGAPELPKLERKQKKKARDLTAQQDKRASTYCDRAWQRYLAEKEKLRGKKAATEVSLRKASESIEKKAFSRKTPAIQEAKRLYQQKVEQDL
jgi:hypothetical protein